MRSTRSRLVFLTVGALMVVAALVGQQVVGEGGWVDRVAQTGALVVGVGIVTELVSRKTGAAAYRTGMVLAVVAAVLLGWVNGAVGLLGAADNRVNLLYGGVVAVGAIGAIVARFKPAGMVIALYAAALAQAAVALAALTGLLGPSVGGVVEILTANGFFVVLFLGSAALFRKAAAGLTST